MRCGVLGSIAPDMDMLYFYLINHRQHHHHTYVTHYPLIWGIALSISLLWLNSGQNKRAAIATTFFASNGLIHMLSKFALFCGFAIYGEAAKKSEKA